MVSLGDRSRGGMTLPASSLRRTPASVRTVITLGSPFAAPGASNVRAIWRL